MEKEKGFAERMECIEKTKNTRSRTTPPHCPREDTEEGGSALKKQH